MLHPNQHAKSSIVSFKEQTIKSIFLAAPGLESGEAEKVIKRGDWAKPYLCGFPDEQCLRCRAMALTKLMLACC